MCMLHHKHRDKTYYHAKGLEEKFWIGKFNLGNHFLFFTFFFQLILVDRSERGHYLMELIAEKQKRDLNNNSVSDEPSDFVAVLQLEDPQGIETFVDTFKCFQEQSYKRLSRQQIFNILFPLFQVLTR